MSASPVFTDWTRANQRLLVAELARLRQQIGGDGDVATLVAAVTEARAAMPAPAAIDVLSELFELSAFERDILLLCAGSEMDGELAAYLAAAPTAAPRGRVSFGLALATLDDPHWSAITPVRPLRRWRLVEVDDASGLVGGALRVDERVLHYLAGVNYLDSRVRSFIRPTPAPGVMSDTHRALADSVREAIANAPPGGVPLVVMTGDDQRGQVDVTTVVCASLALAAYVVRVEDLPSGHAELEAFATLWEREARLLSAALFVIAEDETLPRPVGRLLESLGGLVFLGATQPPSLERAAIRVTVDKPDAVEQRILWRLVLGDAVDRMNGTLDGVAGQFRLSARAIHDVGRQLTSESDADRAAEIVWGACRSLARPKLDELAQRIEAAAGWDDLVLGEPQMTMLRQIGAQVRHRLRVYHDWGFARAGARGLGISALFTGDSGTGKTMAAEVLARDLGLDLYRIDLSAVVSKYIGESEKNLRRVFDAAEESGAVLLFDEADALFGKRSEVKDSHDRYANIEVSYLLQRMESYRGLAILTSNMRSALDVAFLRRLRFVVHFPFPDHEMREAIWRRAFPARAPLGALDFGKLARLNVAGGSIRTIALNAAFAAAEAERQLTMAELLDAARHEAGKRERPLADVETRGWV